ncbi:type III-B CRISPR module RAMP protein Cmr6 [Methylacidiphilum caldifontis]|uniref:Type III-B CRISPR module RAMP protein Cmr6 n=1 Tax=Methylacidiphilum caldifontis TaxID=2795386 RepID=A0A4Y8P7A8_9BACT|nr:type III-B CRISPR module RAMP protein Cmr6 [Methylacidiphilum caldifontis]TFE65870.1 type III-B CRISPR module RAMP protein Cmr6 [Methylacidiphilum caldifontis]
MNQYPEYSVISELKEILKNSNTIQSRSLYFEKYVDPRIKDDKRRDFYKKVIGLKPQQKKITNWFSFIESIPNKLVFYFQLQSRLMVNMAGGVFENAGLCLDRFGVPYIPGSAVKGCVRRSAIQSLLETAGTKEKVQLLVDICLTFGWTEVDWKKGSSDFYYGCNNDENIINCAANELIKSFNIEKEESHSMEADKKISKYMPNFAGLFSFLDAYPIPSKYYPNINLQNDLELEVMSPHHKEYYEGKRQQALDIENPVPIFFPAVSAGHIFCFCILGSKRIGFFEREGKEESLKTKVKQWLQEGLQELGIGAKTAAGYGWFIDVTKQVEEKIIKVEEQERKEKEEKEKRLRQEEEREKEEEKRRAEKEAFEKETKGMSELDKNVYELSKRSDQQFKDKLRNDFLNATDTEKEAFYQLLKDKKKKVWLEIKDLPQKGNKKEKKTWGQIVNEINKMAKQKKEKMPND